MRLDRITDEKLAELKAYMNTQLGGKPNKFSKPRKAAGTINNCLASLSKCLGCAVQWKVIPALPCEIEFLRRPVVAPKFYDFDVYEGLVAAAKALDHRAYLVVLLGGDAGLRLGEILALEQSRCDTRTERLLVELSEVGA